MRTIEKILKEIDVFLDDYADCLAKTMNDSGFTMLYSHKGSQYRAHVGLADSNGSRLNDVKLRHRFKVFQAVLEDALEMIERGNVIKGDLLEIKQEMITLRRYPAPRRVAC